MYLKEGKLPAVFTACHLTDEFFDSLATACPSVASPLEELYLDGA
mgnify:CR=1 FL=1